MTELMSKAQFARHRGVGRSAVSNWITRGQLAIVDGKVDVAASEALLDASVDPGRGRPPEHDPQPGGGTPAKKTGSASSKPAAATAKSEGDGDADNLRELRAQQLRETAHGAALKNAKMAGDLVPATAAGNIVESTISGFLDRAQADLRNLADMLVRETDPRKGRKAADEWLARLRENYADELEAQQQEG